MTARWSQGDVDDVVEELPSILDRIRAAGVVHNLLVATAQAVVRGPGWATWRGAGRYLAEARQAQGTPGGDASPRLALAEAACLLAGGDEPGAAAVIEAAARTASTGSDRRPSGAGATGWR